MDGSIALRKLNLDCDRQADLTVHGGPSKAVYAYPREHYDYGERGFRRPPRSWARLARTSQRGAC